MGRSLGDRTGKQVLSRLSQLGSLLAHCASILKDKGENLDQFISIGTEIREIALTLSIGDEEDENAQDAIDSL